MTLRALAKDEITASKRPRAALVLFVWELAWALLVSAPVYQWSRHVWAAHPDGDAKVFEPGGQSLLAWLDGSRGVFVDAVVLSAFLLACGAILAQLPLGVALASLATGRSEKGRAPTLGEALRASAGSFVALAGVLVLTVAVEGALLAGGFFVGEGVGDALRYRVGDARAIPIAFAVFGVFALVAGVVGVIADLARAAIVRDVTTSEEPVPTYVRLGRAFERALRGGYRSIARSTFEWSLRAGIGIALIVIGGAASQALSERGELALVGLLVIHQAIVLARAGLRTSWLACALRNVAD